MDKLQGQNFLVIGASSGMGKSIAERLTRQCGANVILVARRYENIKKMAEELPGDNRAIYCDLQNLASVEEIFQNCVEMGIKLDGLIFAAGIAPSMSIAANDIADMQRTVNTNALSFLECGKYMLDSKYVNENAKIVAISSNVSQLTTTNQAVYAGSKAMLNTFVKFLAREGIGKLRVNAILPGATETELLQKMKLKNENLEKALLKYYPLGIINTDEISDLTIFLLSESSRFMTGELIRMDSGHSLMN